MLLPILLELQRREQEILEYLLVQRCEAIRG